MNNFSRKTYDVKFDIGLNRIITFKNIKNLFFLQIKKMGSCLDLREYQDSPEMSSILGKLLSGKSGYKAVVEKRKEVIKCSQCGKILEGTEKFCPECGNKVK